MYEREGGDNEDNMVWKCEKKVGRQVTQKNERTR